MKIRRKMLGRGLATVLVSGVALAAVFVARSPAFAALTKSKEPFVSHALDARVRYEPGAERYADLLAPYLDTAVAHVEAWYGRPMAKPFEVFACATQESLNEFVALPPGAPIRGTVRLGDVFIAPSAFAWEGRDTHRESLTHELAHLHLRQRLGTVAYLKNVPGWFHEALADLIAGSGGEGISDEEAREAIHLGRALAPDSSGSLFRPKRAHSYRMPAPMLHKQATMFLDYVRRWDPEAFRRFLSDLQDEGEFAGPFRRHLGAGVGEWWHRFVAGLRETKGPG